MKRALAATTAALTLSSAAGALADPPREAAGAAEALFYEARALMKDGRFREACPKLEESLRLDRGIGTEYNLADCNESIGRLATAWSGFVSVAEAAKEQGQHDREQIARARARALEDRVPRLAIDVLPGAPRDLEVSRDGISVDAGSWGAPLPVDPGVYTVRATAPGKQPWQAQVTVAEGERLRVAVPRELAPLPGPPAAPPALASARIVDFPAPIVEPRGTAQRTIGWIVAGLGIGGLGVGAGFGLDSLQRRNRSKHFCDGDLCDARGLALRDRALASGDIATVATITGGAALLGGAVLVLTSPRARSGGRASGAPTVWAAPRVARDGGAISVEGVLP